MPDRITFALVGDPANPGAHIDDAEWERLWSQRLTVELEVDERETLGSLVARALPAFGVVGLPQRMDPATFVDLGLYEEEEAGAKVWHLALLDEGGRATWTSHDLRLIPYSELVRSAEVDAVTGDPRRLYLILREPTGNGLGIDWPTILHAWELIDEVVGRVGAYGGAAATIVAAGHYLRARLARGREAVDRNVHRWSQRGAWPYTLFRFLDRPRWSASRLAELLGCSDEDAEAVLALFGFAYSEEEDVWRRRGDDAGRILSQAFEEAAEADIELSDHKRQVFEERIDQLVRSGVRPPEREYPAEDFPSWEEIERWQRIRGTLLTGGIATGAFVAGLIFGRRRDHYA